MRYFNFPKYQIGLDVISESAHMSVYDRVTSPKLN